MSSLYSQRNRPDQKRAWAAATLTVTFIVGASAWLLAPAQNSSEPEANAESGGQELAFSRPVHLPGPPPARIPGPAAELPQSRAEPEIDEAPIALVPLAEAALEKQPDTTAEAPLLVVADSLDFGAAFNLARRELGGERTFVWQGRAFTTDWASAEDLVLVQTAQNVAVEAPLVEAEADRPPVADETVAGTLLTSAPGS